MNVTYNLRKSHKNNYKLYVIFDKIGFKAFRRLHDECDSSFFSQFGS